MRTCPNCGTEIDYTSIFCPLCGTRCESSKSTKQSVKANNLNLKKRIWRHPMRTGVFSRAILDMIVTGGCQGS